VSARIALRQHRRRVSTRRFHNLANLCRTMAKDMFDPYRPELHYMRGPGPRWREKQACAASRYAGRELAPARA
jgi:hypothetical protein